MTDFKTQWMQSIYESSVKETITIVAEVELKFLRNMSQLFTNFVNLHLHIKKTCWREMVKEAKSSMFELVSTTFWLLKN